MRLVAIAGRKSSGKDTVARIIEICTYNPYEKIKFVGKLKEMTATLIGCRIEDLEDYHFKEKPLEGWGGINPRQILQEFGSCGRSLYKDIWVASALANLRESGNYLIPDLRYPNEVSAIKKLGGYVIRVERPSLESTDTHHSETALDEFKDWDYIITNDGGLKDLAVKVHKMCQMLEL